MKEVTLSRTALLDELKKNRDEHRKIYDEAKAGYSSLVLEHLKKALEDAIQDALKGKKLPEFVRLPKRPVNHLKEYERAIRMCELGVDETIKLTASEFDMYVLDRWGWKRGFLMENSSYSTTATMAMADNQDDDDDY